jgi:hypothetical protein
MIHHSPPFILPDPPLHDIACRCQLGAGDWFAAARLRYATHNIIAELLFYRQVTLAACVNLAMTDDCRKDYFSSQGGDND